VWPAALVGCFGTDGEDPGDNETDNESDNESTGGTDCETGDSEPLGARDPDPVEFSGSGNGSTDSFAARQGVTILDIEPITGMTVDVVDAGGSVWRSLDWDLQNYQGMVPVDIPRGEYLHELHANEGIFEADVTVNYGDQGWLVIAASSDYEISLSADEGEIEPETDSSGNSS